MRLCRELTACSSSVRNVLAAVMAHLPARSSASGRGKSRHGPLGSESGGFTDVLDNLDQECDIVFQFMESMTAAAQDRCPVCHTKVVVTSADEVVIRNAILRVDRPTG